jgi:hypothetical protein
MPALPQWKKYASLGSINLDSASSPCAVLLYALWGGRHTVCKISLVYSVSVLIIINGGGRRLARPGEVIVMNIVMAMLMEGLVCRRLARATMEVVELLFLMP